MNSVKIVSQLARNEGRRGDHSNVYTKGESEILLLGVDCFFFFFNVGVQKL